MQHCWVAPITKCAFQSICAIVASVSRDKTRKTRPTRHEEFQLFAVWLTSHLSAHLHGVIASAVHTWLVGSMCRGEASCSGENTSWFVLLSFCLDLAIVRLAPGFWIVPIYWVRRDFCLFFNKFDEVFKFRDLSASFLLVKYHSSPSIHVCFWEFLDQCLDCFWVIPSPSCIRRPALCCYSFAERRHSCRARAHFWLR